MSKLRLFEYAIIKQPKRDKGDVVEKGGMVKGVDTIMAVDEKQATMLIAREIPEAELSNLDRLEVVIRPF